MTPEEQRIAIAEACGFPKPFYKSKDIRVGGKMAGMAIWNLPDYLNDLNAMHEAEKEILFKDVKLYLKFATELEAVVGGGVDALFATAAQRAEAFLRTLELWKDDK